MSVIKKLKQFNIKKGYIVLQALKKHCFFSKTIWIKMSPLCAYSSAEKDMLFQNTQKNIYLKVYAGI